MKIDTDKYISWLESGKTFQDVREDLRSLGFADDDINQYIRILDKDITTGATNATVSRKTNARFIAGLLITCVGLAATLLFCSDWE